MIGNSLFFYILFLLIKIIIPLPNCTVNENHCTKCNPVTKLCERCELDIYIPDDKGGCNGAKKCRIGFNHCSECDVDYKLCKVCEDNYFPDENGGCALINNCGISYQGDCLECSEDFILIGTNLKLCKSLNADDLNYCKNIDIDTGKCKKCEEGYFLNFGDKKCSSYEHCYESLFDTCIKCNSTHYLDMSEHKCIIRNGTWVNCERTLDGLTCDKCNENNYFDENGTCIGVNYCSEGDLYVKCKRCNEGYYLAKTGNCCTKEPNCDYGDKDLGVCTICPSFYYIDFKDGKCRPNNKDDDYKYCTKADGECYQCASGTYLGEDKKCSLSKNCAESYLGNCTHCVKDYHLGKNNICTNIDKCVLPNDHGSCEECIQGYYYNYTSKTCMEEIPGYENCQIVGISRDCSQCRIDFYLNKSDYLCYSNLEPNDFYKCAYTLDGKVCFSCIEDYYIGYLDNKCTKVEGCMISENEDRCLLCDDIYCLNKKTGLCMDNQYIEDENYKFYYKCNITNDEGNKCEICLDGYEHNNKDLCEDFSICEKFDEEGNCMQCKRDNYTNYCLNDYIGCTDTYFKGCELCNNITDFNFCTKCQDGYKLVDGECLKIE